MHFRLSNAVGASDEMEGDGTSLRVLCQESCSVHTWQTFYSQNGPQEPCVPFKFDCTQICQMEGPALGRLGLGFRGYGNTTLIWKFFRSQRWEGGFANI